MKLKKKLGVPKKPSSAVELEMMEKSMNLIKEVEKQLLQGVDRKSLLPMLEEALKICPKNDAAYGVRGQLHKSIFIAGNDFDYLLKALDDFEKALDLNGYNLIATREYLTLLALSAELYKDEGNKAKTDEIMQIIDRCKDICDVTNTIQILAKNAEEKQSQ
ncbi:hypothetical protein AVEN_198898-1 [Araneus ventricosus]|uniref:Tetratricopeptide repeat protein n=1 Tax=Araneus ventricosus TaxID=182803 RepID=A0A4Y2NFH2_ARAVE|nr:hypothetical protein AVEN_198898-1 [Araneus ventricosus]